MRIVLCWFVVVVMCVSVCASVCGFVFITHRHRHRHDHCHDDDDDDDDDDVYYDDLQRANAFFKMDITHFDLAIFCFLWVLDQILKVHYIFI